jgi:hypothetical protein
LLAAEAHLAPAEPHLAELAATEGQLPSAEALAAETTAHHFVQTAAHLLHLLNVDMRTHCHHLQ